MKKCTFRQYEYPQELADGDVVFVLHTGIYSEKFYDALEAFYYIYNRDVYIPQIELDGKPIDRMFISQFNLFSANSCMRCFYGLFVDPSGELIFESRYNTKAPMCKANSKSAVKKILVEKMNEMADVLRKTLPIYASLDSVVTVVLSAPQVDMKFRFKLSMLEDLIETIEAGGDNGAQNDPIIAERNRTMQKVYADLMQRMHDLQCSVLFHPDFGDSIDTIGEKGVQEFYEALMQIIRKVDQRFADDIKEFIENVKKLDCFIEDIMLIEYSFFGRFQKSIWTGVH